jgi:hypothetical protein
MKPGRLVMSVREGIGERVTAIVTNMEEIIWVGVSKERNSNTEICVSFSLENRRIRWS